MKEIISAVVFIATLWGGTTVLKKIHDHIRQATLEKAAQGLPSLQGMNRAKAATRKRCDINQKQLIESSRPPNTKAPMKSCIR